MLTGPGAPLEEYLGLKTLRLAATVSHATMMAGVGKASLPLGLTRHTRL